MHAVAVLYSHSQQETRRGEIDQQERGSLEKLRVSTLSEAEKSKKRGSLVPLHEQPELPLLPVFGASSLLRITVRMGTL